MAYEPPRGEATPDNLPEREMPEQPERQEPAQTREDYSHEASERMQQEQEASRRQREEQEQEEEEEEKTRRRRRPRNSAEAYAEYRDYQRQTAVAVRGPAAGREPEPEERPRVPSGRGGLPGEEPTAIGTEYEPAEKPRSRGRRGYDVERGKAALESYEARNREAEEDAAAAVAAATGAPAGEGFVEYGYGEPTEYESEARARRRGRGRRRPFGGSPFAGVRRRRIGGGPLDVGVPGDEGAPSRLGRPPGSLNRPKLEAYVDEGGQRRLRVKPKAGRPVRLDEDGQPIVRGPGRPPGSRNKPKVELVYDADGQPHYVVVPKSGPKPVVLDENGRPIVRGPGRPPGSRNKPKVPIIQQQQMQVQMQPPIVSGAGAPEQAQVAVQAPPSEAPLQAPAVRRSMPMGDESEFTGVPGLVLGVGAK
ncbi:MAG: hypothetical protein EHM35_10915, partial [Planctomycetaceae bacterium]